VWRRIVQRAERVPPILPPWIAGNHLTCTNDGEAGSEKCGHHGEGTTGYEITFRALTPDPLPHSLPTNGSMRATRFLIVFPSTPRKESPTLFPKLRPRPPLPPPPLHPSTGGRLLTRIFFPAHTTRNCI